MSDDGMRRLPCLLCDWLYVYDPAVPGLREHAMEEGLRHYEVHSPKRDTLNPQP